MISFESDYTTGAHQAILDAFVRTNLEALSGYGTDKYCESAAAKIKAACGGIPDVYFLTGGTQTNQIVIDTMLAPYEGAISAVTGHVNAHEAGAIEYTGHKVIELPGHAGKLDAGEVDAYLTTFFADANHEHMVFPGLVYISYPTEYGTLYSKAELTALSDVCKKHGIPLYMDGARLGYGLASKECDLTLHEIAELTDVFYIGGTKVGALCGEAVVFTKNNMPKHFATRVKQHGAMVAKGRLLGVQFDTLFTGDLYMNISRHAIDMAEKLKELFTKKGYDFFLKSPTNQQFIILENAKLHELSEKVRFSFWEKADENHTVVRFATSWSTTDEDLKTLEEIL